MGYGPKRIDLMEKQGMWWSFSTNNYFFTQFNGGIPASVFLQITTLGLLTGLISIFLRRLLQVKALEATFQSIFQDHLDERRQFKLCPDRRLRDLLYQASDQGLNEEFNTYLAGRFVQQSMAYILPLLLALYWLDQSLPAEGYAAGLGKPFIMGLPWAEYGIPGLPFPILFFAVYLLTLACIAWWVEER